MASARVYFRKSKLSEDNTVWQFRSLTLWLPIYSMLSIFPAYFPDSQRIVCFPLQRWVWLKARSQLPPITWLIVVKSPDYFRASSILSIIGFTARVSFFLTHKEALSFLLGIQCSGNSEGNSLQLQINGCPHPSSGWKQQSPQVDELNTKQVFCLLWNVPFD